MCADERLEPSIALLAVIFEKRHARIVARFFRDANSRPKADAVIRHVADAYGYAWLRSLRIRSCRRVRSLARRGACTAASPIEAGRYVPAALTSGPPGSDVRRHAALPARAQRPSADLLRADVRLG
jgi:hypothetical protein